MGDPAKMAREIRGGHAHQVRIENLVNTTQEKFVNPARHCLSGGNVLKDSESAVKKSVPVRVCCQHSMQANNTQHNAKEQSID